MLPRLLKTARTNSGVSQADLASKLGVARLAITRLESGVGSAELLAHAMQKLEFRLSGIGRGANLSEQLRRRRLQRGWSIEYTANRAQLTRRTVATVESGRGTIASLGKLLAVIAPDARPTERARSSWAFDPSGLAERDLRFTPKWFFDNIVDAFGPIDLDPCGHPSSPVEAQRRIILPTCGLATSWAGSRLVFVNPPYSALSVWMNRTQDAWEAGEADTIVMLVPARTDYEVYQKRISRDAETLFLAGRMRFDTPQGLANAVPFSLMLVVWGGSESSLDRITELTPAVRMAPWMASGQRGKGSKTHGAQFPRQSTPRALNTASTGSE